MYIECFILDVLCQKDNKTGIHVLFTLIYGHTIEQMAVEYLLSVIWNEQPLLEGRGADINTSPIVY